jgi:SAM-dependent methyltransferase
MNGAGNTYPGPGNVAEACPLCGSAGVALYRDVFHQCPLCRGIFRPCALRLDAVAEKARYELHQNHVEDERYQNFVAPLVDAVKRRFSPHHHGLDFGCGPGPVLFWLLQRQGYRIQKYDPFFCPDPAPLAERYDYIVCCEVIEHFYDPAAEFRRLRDLLKPGGRLICKTHLYLPEYEFARWYYKNDETHVFIYCPETIHFLREAIGFAEVTITDRLIEFTG